MTGFRPFFNPATGEWIEYTAVTEDTGGQLIRFDWRSVPGGVITEHIHPHQEERFIVLAGEAHFTLDGARRGRNGEFGRGRRGATGSGCSIRPRHHLGSLLFPGDGDSAAAKARDDVVSLPWVLSGNA